MLDVLTGLQQLLVAAAVILAGGLVAWRLLARVTRRAPEDGVESDPEQVLAQIEAHLGHSFGTDSEPWDGVKRLETGDTHIGF